MTDPIQPPKKVDYVRAFDAMSKGHWVLDPREGEGDAWFDLHRRALITGRKRPRLSEAQERFLAAMGFDEWEPILNPEASKWKKGLHALFSGDEGDKILPPLTSKDSHISLRALESARKRILVDRMIRGLALRESGQEGVPFQEYLDKERSAFAPMSLNQAQSILLWCMANDCKYDFEPWNRVVINRPDRTITAVVNGIGQYVLDCTLTASVLRDLVENPDSPEYGYTFQVVYLFGPQIHNREWEHLTHAKFLVGVSQWCGVVAGFGVKSNRAFSAALKERDLWADYILTQATEQLTLLIEQSDEDEHEFFFNHWVKFWLDKLFDAESREHRCSDSWKTRIEVVLANLVKRCDLLSHDIDRRIREESPRWLGKGFGLRPARPNDPDLLEEPLRSLELERYALHKRQRLKALVGDRPTPVLKGEPTPRGPL